MMDKLRADGLHTLLHWVSERDNVRRKREQGLRAPWTRDKIISTYRFCNVRRRDDRVSRWIINRVISGYADQPSLWIQLALARYINWPDTLNALMEVGLWPVEPSPALWAAIGGFLDKRVREGEQTWTGAYMIRAESNPNAEWYDWGKGRYVAEVVMQGLWENREAVVPDLTRSVQAAWTAIQGHYGFGSFMTGQVVADLTYASWLDDAPDLYTWAPLGPGSRRGLNRLLGRDIMKTLDQDTAVIYMRQIRGHIIDKLGGTFADMTLHDVQNCLCEVDKYIRVKKGEGRPRSLYRSQA